ncbi:MAG TPA: hypothetical protein VLX29_08155 [Nitrospirota bacterium]|nr:hypothetical protein [Nitrospirota bacterium]
MKANEHATAANGMDLTFETFSIIYENNFPAGGAVLLKLHVFFPFFYYDIDKFSRSVISIAFADSDLQHPLTQAVLFIMPVATAKIIYWTIA